MATLGGDPEFEVMSNGKVISADSVERLPADGAVGKDGTGSPIEFRPSPGSVDDVVGSTETLLRGFTALYPHLRLSTRGDTYAIGGHIHFGDLSTYEGASTRSCDNCDEDPRPCDHCSRSRDDYLCSSCDDPEAQESCGRDSSDCPVRRAYNPCEDCDVDTDPCSDCDGRDSDIDSDEGSPEVDRMVRALDCTIGEWAANWSGSARGGYARLGCYELKEWGFEYRPPPASVWGTKALARAYLSAANLVVDAADSHWTPKTFGGNLDPSLSNIVGLGLNVHQAQLLRDFADNGPPPQAVLHGWGIRPGAVHLTDKWNWDIAGGVQARLERSTRPLLVYGLRRDRGLVVAGWWKLGIPQVPHPPHIASMAERLGRVPVGVPWAWRTPWGEWERSRRQGEALAQDILRGVRP